jgi:hypothetical protein
VSPVKCHLVWGRFALRLKPQPPLFLLNRCHDTEPIVGVPCAPWVPDTPLRVQRHPRPNRFRHGKVDKLGVAGSGGEPQGCAEVEVTGRRAASCWAGPMEIDGVRCQGEIQELLQQLGATLHDHTG